MPEFESFDWEGITYPKAYLRAIFNTARERLPQKMLEVGFDQGGSALALLRGSPEGTLESIDITDCEKGRELVGKSDVVDRFTFMMADSREELLVRIEQGLKYDLIYIDGDHLYEAAKQDIENAAQLLSDEGILLIDDAQAGHSHFGVWKAADEFAANNGFLKREMPDTPSHMITLSKI